MIGVTSLESRASAGAGANAAGADSGGEDGVAALQPSRRACLQRGVQLALGICAPTWMGAAAWAKTPPAAAAAGLPRETLQALQRAELPARALSAMVYDATSGARVLAWQAQRPVNPASLTKVLTTLAALDGLGPAWQWRTPVWLDGPVRDGVLEGSLVIQGRGDPTLVLERIWLLLRRVQHSGVRTIRGDIVLDTSAFDLPDADPGAFDGEPLRPYNVRPAALVLNHRAVHYRFVPDAAAGVARVWAEPPLLGATVPTQVPLATGPCGDWRARLKASFEPDVTRFAGDYPSSCGEGGWFVADPQPQTYEMRLLPALWREMGGVLTGSVRPGLAPAQRAPDFEWPSPPLAEVVRDINKFSNNLYAEQLFLTLALQQGGGAPATWTTARDALRQWIVRRTGEPLDAEGGASGLVIDNGSGLSRHTRISVQRLARLLQQAFDGPVMSELMSSLPIAGLDGTLRRSRTATGLAHLKTGTLRDVSGLAGYVLTPSGRRLVLVAIVNHPDVSGARPVLDSLVRWSLRDTPAG